MIRVRIPVPHFLSRAPRCTPGWCPIRRFGVAIFCGSAPGQNFETHPFEILLMPAPYFPSLFFSSGLDRRVKKPRPALHRASCAKQCERICPKSTTLVSCRKKLLKSSTGSRVRTDTKRGWHSVGLGLNWHDQQSSMCLKDTSPPVAPEKGAQFRRGEVDSLTGVSEYLLFAPDHRGSMHKDDSRLWP
jgi:hypothetical protein